MWLECMMDWASLYRVAPGNRAAAEQDGEDAAVRALHE